MRILTTGGAGFIGSDFVRYWLKKYPEDKIINLDLLTYAGNLENLREVENNPNYKFVKGDIGDAKSVNRLVKGMDLIVNFAAETHVDRSIAGSSDFIRTNVEGTRVLLEAAKNNGLIRFHHISTDEVFGQLGPDDAPFTEKTSYDPRSPYAASKAAADHLVRAYFHTYGLPITISNCSNNYGPYQHPEKLIPLSITNILRGKKITLYGSGENIRDWINVRDHNRGVEAIIKKGRIGETYCLGGSPAPGATATKGGGEMTNLDLAKKILALIGKSETEIEFIADRPGHDRRYAIDAAKARQELGWRKEIDFETGLRETIDWYKKNQKWWAKLIKR
ncbi:MAG TPA: dTDP-glucose 4,6-dehydratase [Candidatus Nanoarchaeia archaeon]|nr:dTDP-glucose 4,6-dehydratase [Candidatus Nanoarchaeia archaeon]